MSVSIPREVVDVDGEPILDGQRVNIVADGFDDVLVDRLRRMLSAVGAQHVKTMGPNVTHVIVASNANTAVNMPAIPDAIVSRHRVDTVQSYIVPSAHRHGEVARRLCDATTGDRLRPVFN